MVDKKVEANVSMIVSKTFSGLNMNALKFLLPLWLAPITAVSFRLMFGAIAFWIIGLFCKKGISTIKQKVELILLGVCMYAFMLLYLLGLSMTTPVSSSIFVSLQPVWVFIFSVWLNEEKVTKMKILGISLGLIGAVVCIMTQSKSDLASNPFVGNALCLFSSICYALYLIFSNNMLKKVDNMTLLKYTFLGGAITSFFVTYFNGFDAPVIHQNMLSLPFLILAFVLIFPTTISFMLIPIGLKYLTTTLVAIYGYLILVVTTIVSFLLGQDRFSWTQTCSIILIVASVYFVEVAESKGNRKTPSNKHSV